jgi:dihydroorotate dehydrogenase (fumarate)
MGLNLKNPFIVGSSRLTGDLKNIRECVDAGASAVVLKSLFEEQINLEAESHVRNVSGGDAYYWFPEAKHQVEKLSVEANLEKYLNFITLLKKEIDVPVIASINCVSSEGWPKFAAAIQQAGADAIELNIAIFPLNDTQESTEIESLYVDILKEVKKQVSIPVSVKLGYHFTNLYALANKLVEAGADGLVLFNRYFRPDIDIKKIRIVADEYLSTPEETAIPLRWIALLRGNKLNCDLVASTGVHTHEQVIKQLLVGANAVQLSSTLYMNGNQFIGEIEKGLIAWMKENKFSSLDAFKGKALNSQTTDVTFERIQFMKRDFE